MAKKYFGTDGVRGEVGQFPITPDFVLKLGYAAGQVLVQHDGGQKPTVLIGKDTRISGYMLEAALVAGFTAAGVNVIQTGPLPTPGIAYLTRALRLAVGGDAASLVVHADGRGGEFLQVGVGVVPAEEELAVGEDDADVGLRPARVAPVEDRQLVVGCCCSHVSIKARTAGCAPDASTPFASGGTEGRAPRRPAVRAEAAGGPARA